jgi:glycosyltransferase involved in cell wall biosynthesis
MTSRSISAFFPVLNEEGTVARLTGDLVDILRPQFQQLEVIIVDDGSTDRTGEIVDRLCTENDGIVRAVHHQESQGYGNALKAGFNAARFDLVFFTDGDYQFDLSELDKAFSLIQDSDIVVGFRLDRKDSKLRILLAKGYNLLVRFLFGVKLKDIDCSFKLFRRSALERITIESQGYFIDTEILVKAIKLGLTIKQFGVKHLPRTSGVSKVRMKHIFLTLYEIGKLWKRINRKTKN